MIATKRREHNDIRKKNHHFLMFVCQFYLLFDVCKYTNQQQIWQWNQTRIPLHNTTPEPALQQNLIREHLVLLYKPSFLYFSMTVLLFYFAIKSNAKKSRCFDPSEVIFKCEYLKMTPEGSKCHNFLALLQNRFQRNYSSRYFYSSGRKTLNG